MRPLVKEDGGSKQRARRDAEMTKGPRRSWAFLRAVSVDERRGRFRLGWVRWGRCGLVGRWWGLAALSGLVDRCGARVVRAAAVTRK